MATQLRFCSHNLGEPRRAGCDQQLRDGWLAGGGAKGNGAARKKFEGLGLASWMFLDVLRRAQRRGSDVPHVVGGRGRDSCCSRCRCRRAADDGGCSEASVHNGFLLRVGAIATRANIWIATDYRLRLDFGCF